MQPGFLLRLLNLHSDGGQKIGCIHTRQFRKVFPSTSGAALGAALD